MILGLCDTKSKILKKIFNDSTILYMHIKCGYVYQTYFRSIHPAGTDLPWVCGGSNPRKIFVSSLNFALNR